MAIRCYECNKSVICKDEHNEWLRIFHFIEMLLHQGEITENMFNVLVDSLMYLKPKSIEDGVE